MQAEKMTHPADETLVSYGLGKLEDTVAASVNEHLEQCPPCLQRVAALSSDSFVGRLRQAKPQQADAAPRPKTLVEPAAQHGPRSRISDKQPSILGKPASGKDPLGAHSSGSATALPPELVNHPQYEVIRELGRGGMGVVYLARNKLMDRLEVLKLLSQELLGKQERVERFLREIQAAAKLHHPNVVAAHTAFPVGKLLVFAMEYVEGDDLAKLVRARGPLPVLNACYFAYQTALGLQHAHEHGMIHRDIKPGNLILFRQGKKGTVKILDFGLAKVTSEQRIDGTLTQQGQMLGTPDYIAPEQTLDAQKADIRSDIYSLGCTLYHLLTGSPPFSGSSLYAVLQAHHSTEARMVNLVRPEVPVELAAVVAKMMAKEPTRRYQTPTEVAHALKPFLKPGGLASQPSQSPPSVSQVDRPSAPPIAAGPVAGDEEQPALVPMREIEASERWKSLVDVQSLPPSGAGPALPKPRTRQPPWTSVAVGTGAVLMALIVAWAGGVFKIKTPNGVIVLKNLPDNAEVFVDGEKVAVRFPDGSDAEITVVPGRHEVQIRKGDRIAPGERLTVDRGGREEISVEFEPPRQNPTQQSTRPERGSAANDTAKMPSPAKADKERLEPIQEVIAKAEEVRKNATNLNAETRNAFEGAKAGATRTDNELATTLVWIPPGQFTMGSPEDENGRYYNEAQARITLSKGFWLGQHEVTQPEWRQVMRTQPWSAKPNVEEGDSYPATYVSWFDAVAFCDKLTAEERREKRLPDGCSYKLPSEAQWEYACRAGTTSRYYFGDDESRLGDYAWFDANAGHAGAAHAHKVGQKQANPLGLYDMHGNVLEWCGTWYFAEIAGGVDPKGPAQGSFAVLRGGGWLDPPRNCRTALRTWDPPNFREDRFGFRVSLSLDEPSHSPENPGFAVPIPELSAATNGHTGIPQSLGSHDTPDNRRAWHGELSSFINTGKGQWQETIGNAVMNNFEEVARTADYVELIDRTRAVGGCRFRLLEREAQMIWGGTDKDWSRQQLGKWDDAGSVRFENGVEKTNGFGVGPLSKEKFVPLFNGKNLNGWNREHSDTIQWQVANRALVGVNSGGAGSGGVLVTERADYADFHFRCETMLSEGLNTMVGFRRHSSDLPFGAKRQYCVLIRGTNQSVFPDLADNPQQPTGTLMVGLIGKPPEVLREASQVALKAGEWFTLEIICQGKRIRVLINGSEMVDYLDPANTFSTGSIAFSCRFGSKVQFRNVEIKELAAAELIGASIRGGGRIGGLKHMGAGAASPENMDDGSRTADLGGGTFGGRGPGSGFGGLGSSRRAEETNEFGFGPPSKEKFVRLFNGNDFTNWTFPKGGQEKWSIEDGVLRGDGQSRIATKRADFRNFHLRMRLRTPDQINKHLIFRSREVGGNDADYRFHLGGIKWDHKSTWQLGSYTLLTGEPLAPGQSGTTEGLVKLNFVSMPFLDDKWHRVEIVALNNVFRMILDGQEVSAFRDTRSRFAEGQIVIGLVEGAHLELRDIEINETPSKAPVQGTKKPRRKSAAS